MSTSFTATLAADVSLPEETWLPARVRKHGRSLEVSADEQTAPPAASRLQAMESWLQRCAEQPISSFTDADLDDLRWQGLKEKYGL